MPKKKEITKKSIFEELDGIGPRTAQKLEESGLKSFIDVIIRGTKEYSRITGLNMEQAEKHYTLIRKKLFEAEKLPKIKSLKEKHSYDKKKIYITTGSNELDVFLGKGIETQGVYEFYGAEGSGKTQLSMSVVAESLKKGHRVLFIDCENTFDLDRFNQIMGMRLDQPVDDDFLGKYLDYRVTTDATELKTEIQEIIKEIHNNQYRLIVIDGLVGLERLEYEGRGELAERQSQLKIILKYLRNIAFHLNVAVILTNQITSNPDPFGEREKAIGGHVLGHYVKYIIQIKKAKDRARVATLKKAPNMPERETLFFVTEAGVSDTEKPPKKAEHAKINESIKDDNLLEENKKTVD